jgi:NADPH:quinone reductase-like Zn-dependent oxidoreductase
MVRSRFVPQLRGPEWPALTKGAATAVLAGLLAAGKFTPVIDSTYALERIREAMRHMAED